MPRRDLKSRIDRRLRSLKKLSGADGIRANSPRACKKALESCRKDPAVIEASKFAGVDHNNPAVLAAMLIEFASARFIKGKGGTEEVWDSVMLCSLLRQYLRRVNQRPELSDEKICAQMVRDVKAFKGMAPSTLRRRLRAAMDPKTNLLLRHLLANMQETSREPLVRRGMSLPDWRTLADNWDKVVRA